MPPTAFVSVVQLAQSLVQIALFGGKFLRDIHTETQIKIAVLPPAEFRQALAANPQYGIGLGAWRNGYLGG